MLRYIIKRTLSVIPVLFLVSVLVFLMVHVMPGDPAEIMAGEMATEEDIQNVRIANGFDKSLAEQYITYISRILRGDMGTSYRTHRPVAQELAVRFPNTLLLATSAIIFAFFAGTGIGIISAVHRNSFLDNSSMFLALVGLSIPPFYLGLMLMLFFSVYLNLIPISSDIGIINIILPTLTLSARSLATIARMTRSSLLEVLGQDYIQTVRAQGFNQRRVIFGSALKNSMNSIITVAGIQFGSLLGGAVITEKVFGWPGLGDLVVTAIRARDFPVVQSTILVIAVSFVIVNLVIDIAYAVINPKIRFS